MKVFGTSPAGAVLLAQHPAAEFIGDDGEDFAASPPVAVWPKSASESERADLEALLRPWGWQFGVAEVVSALGVVREVDARLPSVLPLDRRRPVTVLALRGWREWSATTVAEGLKAAGFETRIAETQMNGSHVDSSAAQIAARLDDPVFCNGLRAALVGAEQALLPPILSRASTQLRDSLGRVVGEAVPTWPSLAGEAQLALAKKRLPSPIPLEPLLGLTWNSQPQEPIVIASRRVMATLQTRFAAAFCDDAEVGLGVWACGRARLGVCGLGEEWLSGLRLAVKLGTTQAAA